MSSWLIDRLPDWLESIKGERPYTPQQVNHPDIGVLTAAMEAREWCWRFYTFWGDIQWSAQCAAATTQWKQEEAHLRALETISDARWRRAEGDCTRLWNDLWAMRLYQFWSDISWCVGWNIYRNSAADERVNAAEERVGEMGVKVERLVHRLLATERQVKRYRSDALRYARSARLLKRELAQHTGDCRNAQTGPGCDDTDRANRQALGEWLSWSRPTQSADPGHPRDASVPAVVAPPRARRGTPRATTRRGRTPRRVKAKRPTKGRRI